MDRNKRSVVIDNGTGFTKMGFSGNLDPDFVFPTAIAEINKKTDISVSHKTEEYDFYIGDKALEVASNSTSHSITYPMKNGMIDKWDQMEKFWHQSIYHYLKFDPQEKYFVLVIFLLNYLNNFIYMFAKYKKILFTLKILVFNFIFYYIICNVCRF